MHFNKFGDLLRFLRINKKLTQEDLSGVTGLAVSTIERVENSRAAPKMKTVIQMLDKMGYHLEVVESSSKPHHQKTVDKVACISLLNE